MGGRGREPIHATELKQLLERHMPSRIGCIDRIPLAISIGIEPTRPERAPAVRLDEDHQYRAVSAIAVAQETVTGPGLKQLAIETE